MSEWTSLSCKESTKERLEEMKDKCGDDDLPNLTYDQFLQSLMDTWEKVEEEGYGDSEADVTATVDVDTSEAMQKLDDMDERIQNLDEAALLKNLEADKQDVSELMEELETIQERIKDMDVVSRNQNVIGRIDDLEAKLIEKFERELGR